MQLAICRYSLLAGEDHTGDLLGLHSQCTYKQCELRREEITRVAAIVLEVKTVCSKAFFPLMF